MIPPPGSHWLRWQVHATMMQPLLYISNKRILTGNGHSQFFFVKNFSHIDEHLELGPQRKISFGSWQDFHRSSRFRNRVVPSVLLLLVRLPPPGEEGSKETALAHPAHRTTIAPVRTAQACVVRIRSAPSPSSRSTGRLREF